MSWDSKALLILTLTWGILAIIYVTVIGMVTGARGWGTGAVIFLVLLLGLLYAERQGADKAKRKLP